MKIVNIDAKQEDLKKINFEDLFSFIYDVVRPLEKELFKLQLHRTSLPLLLYFPSLKSLPHAPVRTFLYAGYANVANLLHTIPIYLRDERSEAKCEDEGEDKIDLLGAYYPNTKEDNPYIELFIAPILDCVKGNKQKLKWLFTKVLIHELAHAALDLNNIEDCRFTHNKISYYTDFGKWREESMANAIALRIIKEYGDTDFYKYAKSFMLSQPPEYALGVLMEDFDDKDFRSLICNKEKGVHNDFQKQWLEYVQNGKKPTLARLKWWNEILMSRYVFIFNGKYYTEEFDLVVDIIINVLNKFKTAHGRKMKINEFEGIFPNIKIYRRNAYEPSSKVKNDDYYKFFAKISNINYSLHRSWSSWDNKKIHDFVSKSGCNFKEYKNYDY